MFLSSDKPCRYCCSSSGGFSSYKCRCSGKPQDDEEGCFSVLVVVVMVEGVEMLFLELIKMKKGESSKYWVLESFLEGNV